METDRLKRENSNSQLPAKFPLRTGIAIKHFQIFKTLEEAFKVFDNLDESKKTQPGTRKLAKDIKFTGGTVAADPLAEPVSGLSVNDPESEPAKADSSILDRLIADSVGFAEELEPLPQDPEVDSYLLRNALLLVDAGELPLARNVLGSVLRHNSNNVDAIRWMGWCFRNEGNLENAQKCYEQLTQRRVTEQDLYELGEIYYLLAKDQLALDTWVDALGQSEAESPRLFDLHKGLGNVYLRLGDLDSAEENYNKALTIRPHSDILHVNIGSLHFQKHDLNLALHFFKKAIDLNPYNDRAWCGVALAARENKDVEWARAVLLKALDLNPNCLTALQVLISWAQQDRFYDDAIDRVQSYLESHQYNADMLYSLAGLLFQSGQLTEAEIELTRLEALQPKREGIQELRSLIELKRGCTTHGS